MPKTQSLPSSPRLTNNLPVSRPPRLGAKPVPSTSFDKSTFSTNLQPHQTLRASSPPLQPQHVLSFSSPSAFTPQKPNYNISLSDASATPSSTFATPPSYTTPNYTSFMTTSPHPMTSPPLQASPLSMGSMLAPMQPTRPVTTNKPLTKDDWGDFDPLK
jgi:SCY1-like protein 2